jgi:hypothetical protein
MLFLLGSILPILVVAHNKKYSPCAKPWRQGELGLCEMHRQNARTLPETPSLPPA